MVRKCTKNSRKWMSQNSVVLAAIDVAAFRKSLSGPTVATGLAKFRKAGHFSGLEGPQDLNFCCS